MPKVYFFKGLPASGKSTEALKRVRENPNGVKRVNKDDLRAMMDAGKHSHSAEKFVKKIRDKIILAALAEGKSVIVDDTNLALDPVTGENVHYEHIRQLIKTYNETGNNMEGKRGPRAELTVVDFTNVPPEECVERDSKRPNPVGPEVIWKMYNDYLKPKEENMNHNHRFGANRNPELPDALIVDIDGTLAIHAHRDPFDTSKYHTDEPNEPVMRMVKGWLNSEGCKFIITSGRDENFRDVTTKWLNDHGIFPDFFWMRPAGDRREDSVVKQEIFDNHIKGKFNVLAAIDDRMRVVNMWRRNGLHCFQVAEGNF